VIVDGTACFTFIRAMKLGHASATMMPDD